MIASKKKHSVLKRLNKIKGTKLPSKRSIEIGTHIVGPTGWKEAFFGRSKKCRGEYDVFGLREARFVNKRLNISLIRFAINTKFREINQRVVKK